MALRSIKLWRRARPATPDRFLINQPMSSLFCSACACARPIQGVVDLTFHEGLAGIAAQLLGVPSVNLWQDQALYKEPGGRETTAHQDQPFWPIGKAPLISAWIPLNAVDEGNGAMAYVPGSHLAGPLKVVDITHTSKPFDILNDPALKG